MFATTPLWTSFHPGIYKPPAWRKFHCSGRSGDLAKPLSTRTDICRASPNSNRGCKDGAPRAARLRHGPKYWSRIEHSRYALNAMVRLATLLLHLFVAELGSEAVEVRDRGIVDLKTFECRDINRSSLIQRVCYDQAQGTLIVGIKNVYEQYCDLSAPTFDGLMSAPSMGQFFNRNIRGAGSGGAYDCLTH